jgi:hypothetical protein
VKGSCTVIDGKLHKTIYKIESLEDMSKETNVKVKDLTARVLYFIQENAEYNKRPDQSSDSDDNVQKRKPPSDNSSSDKKIECPFYS